MSYFSLYYLFAFLPFFIVVYYFVPKYRRLVLIFANMMFYYICGLKLITYLLVTIISIYFSTRLIDKIDNKKEELLKKKNADKVLINKKTKTKRKVVFLLCLLLNVGLLFAFKYLPFFTTNVNNLLDLLHIKYNFKIIKFLAPVGISFYTLQALSYLFDVYNKRVKADKSFLKVALFISFFPQVIEGPIGRFSDTADDLYDAKPLEYKNLCFGYQRIMFGFFKKKIIADRLNILVKLVFLNYASYSGFVSFLGALAYTIMLYMEFSGTMDIVIGSSEIFGIKVQENFKQPFFAKNISEFWTRWHISLGAWFRDYIYYPLSLSKPLKKLTMKMRKVVGNHYGPLISGSIALAVVWFLNGLWHGAGYTFLFFGLYHFVFIVLGNFFGPVIVKLCAKLHINRENKVYRVIQSLKMTFFVIIGELFFRAPNMSVGFGMVKRIFTNFSFKSKELLNLGLDIYDYIILIIALIILL